LTDLENMTTAMQDLAELLRTERLRRGWTLHDVSIRTHLSITVLKTLEEGRFESIGAPVIVEKLLRNYSTVLEIDAKSPGQGGANDVPGTETGREPAPSGEKVGGRKSAVIASLACCGLAVIFLGLSLSGWKGLKTGIQTQGTQPGAGEDQAVKPSRTLSEPRIEGGEQPEVPRQVQLPAEKPVAENESSSPLSGSTPAGPHSPANPADSVQSSPGWEGLKTGIQTRGTQPGAGEDQAVKPSRSLSEPRIEGGEQPEVPRQVQLPAEKPVAENESSSPSSGGTPAGPHSPANPADSVQSSPGWKGLKTGNQTRGTQPGAGEDQAVKPSRTLSEPRIEGGEQPEVPRQVQLPAEKPVAENESSSPLSGSTPAGPHSPANPADSVQISPGPADTEQGLEPQPDRVALQANPEVSAQPVAEPVKTNHHLEIQADQRTWVQVVVDEGNAESELFQPGETGEWKPMERARVVIGNGGGVRIKWDGKPVEISAKTGRVVRLTLPMP